MESVHEVGRVRLGLAREEKGEWGCEKTQLLCRLSDRIGTQALCVLVRQANSVSYKPRGAA